MSSVVGNRSRDGWKSLEGREMRLSRVWEDRKGPQMPRAARALEVSVSGSSLLKVAAMERPLERPKLEAGRLVGLSPGFSKRSEASAGAGAMGIKRE